ncbi:hypothetical protein [Tenacibaculum sp.]|uniref:hypothetical protein n=1 Tax=Tenacibaculum sp. TaxID=1906242 RepID=UPI003D0DA004
MYIKSYAEKEVKLCATCGTAYPTNMASTTCMICLDERQWVPQNGQIWIPHSELLKTHSVKLNRIQENFYELIINPKFAIGQRALLVLSEHGNILWDCIPLLDELTIEFIKAKGGLKAIAFSHPHFYSNMNEWADIFDCPILIHKNDAEHIMVKEKHLILWEGDELELWDGMKLYLIGGHFAGSSILHVPHLSKKGAILCGDTLYLSPNKQHFSVVWSSPNRMPLPLSEIRRIQNRFEQITFDTFYGFVSIQNLTKNVKEILKKSFDRYK